MRYHLGLVIFIVQSVINATSIKDKKLRQKIQLEKHYYILVIAIRERKIIITWSEVDLVS